MKALIAPALGRLELGDVAVPPIRPGQVLIRTQVSAVSAGTEKRKLYTAELGPNDVRDQWPVIGGFGYMLSGTIEALGAGVSGLDIGQRVYAGRTWGAHRELVDTDATSVVPLPDGLSAVDGACAYWAVPPLLGLLAVEPALFDDAVVVGLGPIGLMAVQLLARLCRRVVAIDPIAARGALAIGLGAAAFVPATDRPVERVRAVLPDGAHVVLEVSGTQPGLETALAVVRPKGRVGLVGSQQRLDRFDLFWPLQHSGARIVPLHREGTASPQAGGIGNPTQLWVPVAQELLMRGWLRVEPLISWVVPPELAPRAMDLLHRRPDLAVGMAVAWDGSQVRNVEAFERAWSDGGEGSG
ncbi:MAG TPA: zinc-binding alcohol dehydrogenase [Candidatus Saccharimonadales bacterium]|nr:zinc-binding alcohol dehydrogenase [Candidatus Saccharimonadales bacterium]